VKCLQNQEKPVILKVKSKGPLGLLTIYGFEFPHFTTIPGRIAEAMA
jgi:hypothetical protein